MCQLAHVVNTIIKKAKDEGTKMTAVKLQKLLFYLYRDYYKETQIPLFAERFVAWEYGPVVEDVYYAFKHSDGGYIPDAEGKLRSINFQTSPIFTAVFNSVWNNYGDLTGRQLAEFTHQIGGAWRKAVANNYPFLRDEDIREDMTGEISAVQMAHA